MPTEKKWRRMLRKKLGLLNLDKGVYREIVQIAIQMVGDSDELPPSDLAQLADLALSCQREIKFMQMANKADDAQEYLKFTKAAKDEVVLRRGLLRDLKATKLARSAGTKPSEEVTPGDWAGVV